MREERERKEGRKRDRQGKGEQEGRKDENVNNFRVEASGRGEKGDRPSALGKGGPVCKQLSSRAASTRGGEEGVKEELVGAAKKRGWNRSGEGVGGGGEGERVLVKKEKGSGKGRVGELEECHNSLQIGEADVQSLTWPCTVPFEVWREGVCIGEV